MNEKRYKFCPKCGASLDVLPTPDDMWLNAFRCSNVECHATYLEVMDMQNVFSLQETFPNIPEKLMQASPKKRKRTQLALAEAQVDYKTVSIVPLENIILGIEQ